MSTSTNVVVLDVGDALGLPGLIGQLKAEIAIEAMELMFYDMFNIGEQDLNFGADFLLDYTEDFHVPSMSANVVYEDLGETVTESSRIVAFDNVTVGFIGVVSKEYDGTILDSNVLNARRVAVLDETSALQGEIDKIKGEVDIVVAVAHVGLDDCKALAEETEGADVIICGHGDDRTDEPLLVNGTYIMKSGPNGEYVGRLVLKLDKDKRIRNAEGSVVFLDAEVPEDEELLSLMNEYRDRLEDHKDELLDIEQRDPDTGGRYVGWSACQYCHDSERQEWSGTDHAEAFASLEARGQDYNPECIPCHTTGFGYTGGFIMPDLTEEMEGVQCEMCHGAGGEHSETQGVPYGQTSESTCTACHTPERSPQFDYATYYASIRH